MNTNAAYGQIQYKPDEPTILLVMLDMTKRIKETGQNYYFYSAMVCFVSLFVFCQHGQDCRLLCARVYVWVKLIIMIICPCTVISQTCCVRT